MPGSQPGMSGRQMPITESTMTDKKIILTADQAIELLTPGDLVHNYASGPGMLIGCDYTRDQAIKTLREAASIELAGPFAMKSGHPIACWEKDGRVTFFAGDIDKARAFEVAQTIGDAEPEAVS